jgi:hypothetical protein
MDSKLKNKTNSTIKKSKKDNNSGDEDNFENNKFLKKNSAILIFKISLIIIFLFITFFYFGLNINYLLGNDVYVTLDISNSDMDKINLINGDIKEIPFKYSVKTNPFCTAYCLINKTDLSENKSSLYNKTNMISLFDYYDKIELQSNYLGDGEKYYNIEIICNTKKSLLCKTKTNNSIIRNKLLVVNYSMNSNELYYQNKTKQLFLDTINNTLRIVEKTQSKDEKLKVVNSYFDVESDFELNDLLFNINGDFNSHRLVMEDSNKLWINSHFQDLFYVLEESNQKINQIDEKTKKIIYIIDNYYSKLTYNEKQINENIIFYNYYKLLSEEISSNFNDKNIIQIKRKIDEYKNKINVSIFFYNLKNSYDVKYQVSYNIKGDILSDINNKNHLLLNELINYNKSLINLQNEINIYLKQVNNNINSNDIKNDTSNLNQTTLLNLTFQKSANLTNYLNEKIVKNHHYIQKEFDNNKMYQNNFSNNISLFYESFNIFCDDLDNIYANIIKSNNLANSSINSNLNNSNISKSNTSFFYYNISKFEKCKINTQNFYADNDEFNNYFNKLKIQKKTDINQSNISIINTSVEFLDNSDLLKPNTYCRINNVHYICNNDKTNYPILFLHGHAFNKDTSVQYSLDTFNDWQNELFKQNMDFINAGTFDYFESKNRTNKYEKTIIFENIPKPLTFKVSYYYKIGDDVDSADILESKEENITTYSDRLNKIIEIVKQKTGKDKVIIVAHSMGGLVTREYIRKYSSNSIKAVLLFGTPNHGISGLIDRLCPLTGGKLECIDMNYNSNFIKKLNDNETNNQDNKLISMFIGIGCEMDEKENGDGVVYKKSAKLKGSQNYYIRGTCDRTTFFHNTMLDYSIHPEIFELFKEVLKTNYE